MPDTWPTASMAELITMCTSPVLIGLGIVPVPGQEETVVDLPMARHFIDLLALLDEKTADSLSAEEQQAIDQSLHELRMAFVQVQQTVADSESDTLFADSTTDPAAADAPKTETETDAAAKPETERTSETDSVTDEESPPESTSDAAEGD